MRFQNKIVVVTGGTGGIGRSIAQRFVAEGARVALADVSREKAEEVAVALGNGAAGFGVHVTNNASIYALVTDTVAHLGPIDVLMGAILNGLALVKLRAFGSGFLIFSDYGRVSLRLAAIMELPVILYIYP